MFNRTLADQIQLWGFEGNVVVFSDSSFGFGLELGTVDSSCWDEATSESFSERCKQFLNGLPAEIDFQFIYDIAKGSESILVKHAMLSKSDRSIASELAHARVERYRELEERELLPKFALRLFARRKPSLSLLRKKNWFRSKKQFELQSEERLNEEVQLTEKLCSEIKQALNSLGVKSEILSASEIATLFYKQWNPVRISPIPSLDFEDVRSDLLFTDVSIGNRGFSLSDVNYRVISLKRLPDHTFSTMVGKLAELPFGSRLSLSIGTLNQEKELSKLQTQRRFAFAMAKGKSGVSDIESEAKFQDLESLLESMVAQGEKVFRLSLNIVLSSTSESDLDTQVSETLLKLRELSGAEGMEETVAAFDVFLESSIPNSRSLERAKWIETSNLANLLPLFSPWVGHETPCILLRSRLGSLIGFDPFSKDLPNFNHVVTGGSGAGKSFLTNLLLLQMLKEA